MAIKDSLVLQLLDPEAARQLQMQEERKAQMAMAGRNPLLQQAYRTAGMLTGSLGRALGTDMRSPTVRAADRIQSYVQGAGGDYGKAISAARQAGDIAGTMALAQAQKALTPEVGEGALYTDPTTNTLFRGRETSSGVVVNADTGQPIRGALPGDRRPKKEKVKPVDLSGGAIRQYDIYAKGPNIEAKLESMAATEPGFFKGLFGLKGDPDENTLESLKYSAMEMAERLYTSTADTQNPLTRAQAYNIAINSMYEQFNQLQQQRTEQRSEAEANVKKSVEERLNAGETIRLNGKLIRINPQTGQREEVTPEEDIERTFGAQRPIGGA